MQTSTVVKVIAAFLAGLVLVMGGGLIYSRTRELMYPVDIARPVPHAEQASFPVAPQASSIPEAKRLEQPAIPRKIRPARDIVHPQIVRQRTPVVPEFGQPVKPGPKIYQITSSYPVPILVPSEKQK